MQAYLKQIKTNKITKVTDPKIRLMYWVAMFILVTQFLIGLYFNPTWMHFDDAVGGVQIELSGSAHSTFQYGAYGSHPQDWNQVQTLVYDAHDLRIPSVERDAIFITTWVSPHLSQSRGPDVFCGDPTKPCKTDKDCTKDNIHKSFFGEDINVCIDFFCYIRGWCPIQYPTSIREIENVENMELFIKAVVSFPEFHLERKNFDSGMRKVSSLNSFKIKDILSDIWFFLDYEDIRNEGMIILMTIAFNGCMAHEDTCEPNVKFTRLDKGLGFGFLYNIYQPVMLVGNKNSELPESRTTLELKGIRLLVSVQGGMHKFNMVGLILAIGSMVGLLGTAHMITDIVLLNVHPKRHQYVLHKYRYVERDHMIQFVDEELLKHLTNLGYY